MAPYAFCKADRPSLFSVSAPGLLTRTRRRVVVPVADHLSTTDTPGCCIASPARSSCRAARQIRMLSQIHPSLQRPHDFIAQTSPLPAKLRGIDDRRFVCRRAFFITPLDSNQRRIPRRICSAFDTPSSSEERPRLWHGWSYAESRPRVDCRNRTQELVDGLELTIRHLAVDRQGITCRSGVVSGGFRKSVPWCISSLNSSRVRPAGSPFARGVILRDTNGPIRPSCEVAKSVDLFRLTQKRAARRVRRNRMAAVAPALRVHDVTPSRTSAG